MKSLFTLFATLLFSLTGFAGDWQTLDGCRLLPNKANDGDSFHVEHARREYIFRLYYVDTPETDDSFPERVAEQAEYFGVSTTRVLQIGDAAKQFTAHTLTGPFTVITRWQDARGRSRLPRHYAFVIGGGRSLADLLVQNGLARVFGEKAVLPDRTSTKVQQLKLLALEHHAKSTHAGGWSNGQITAAQTHRLFAPSSERHNARCRFFNAPNTRSCAPNEGKACLICGG